MKGLVFDIQRCCFHDGPGIRTAVFLKGCPLKCAWCHNPESISFEPQLMYNESKCNNCGICEFICTGGTHKFIDGRHEILLERCVHTGACAANCPSGALKIAGYEIDSSSVMDTVMRDESFYKYSGGGVTLSGGEPLSQFDFSFDILRIANEKGIHTCVETCGFAKTKQFETIMPLVDLFLFDYKETDPDKHKQHTGVDNDLILTNLKFLHDADAEIILRCPIIPGVNDGVSHLEGIAALAKRFPKIQRVELMPYHRLGLGKAKQLGLKNYFVSEEAVTDELKEKWLDTIKSAGCTDVAYT